MSEWGHIVSHLGLLPEGHPLDIANATFGVIYFTLVLVHRWLPLPSSRAKAKLVFAVTLPVVGVSLYLMYVLFAVLGDLCLVCVSIYAVNLAVLVLSYRGFVGYGGGSDDDGCGGGGGVVPAVPPKPGPPDPVPTANVGSLELMATNEYGEYDRRAAALYGLDMVVEPFKETTITVLNPTEVTETCNGCSSAFHWSLIQTAPDGTPLANLQPVVDTQGPETSLTITLPEAKTRFSLLVRQLNLDDTTDGDDGSSGGGGGDGVVIAEQRKDVFVKYVRRELRDLTEEDREVYFSTMAEFYRVSIREGKEKYGTAFGNSDLMAAYHNSRNYCFHSGMHFLNAHVAFDLWGELSMQMINPKFALHYWDFTLDAATLGPNWTESEIFTDEMFGPAMGNPDNMYQINSGWFKDVTSMYDPDRDFELDFIDPGHNAFGFIDAQFNYQSLRGIARTNSYCGLKGEMEFATCNKLIGCFDDNDSIYDWTVCMEDQIHASNHGMIGGSFACNTDMGEFHGAHPEYGSGLLSFVLEYITVHRWPSNFMTDYNRCDMACDLGDEDCGCVCNTDIDDWTDDEVYDYMSSTMSTLFGRAHGAKYVHVDEAADRVYSFKQDGEVLSDDQTILLLRTLMTIGCEPGSIGAMSVGPSNLDPIFWPLHPLFEKATHILLLSPTYKETYDFTWVGKDCGDGISGGQIDEEMPFSAYDLGYGDDTTLLTNEQIQQMLHPSNPEFPYLYDKFGNWGTCEYWDFEFNA
eukprot:g6866.t2